MRDHDKKPLRVADAIPQLMGFPGALRRELGIRKLTVHPPQGRMGHRELGVDPNSALEMGNSRRLACREPELQGRTIGLQGFERWCSCLGERSRMLCDRRQRFAHSRAEFTGNLTEGIQHVFFFRNLRLFATDTLSLPPVPSSLPPPILP